MNDVLRRLKHIFAVSKDIVVFTGAGISTESGIADYRSLGGIWERFQPVTIQEFQSDAAKRKLYWERKRILFEENKNAKPNDGHRAIVTLEKQGKLRALITQNIDGLHQLAGISDDKILEIHGTSQQVICLSCGDCHPWQHAYERLLRGEEAPLCRQCHGLLKPNTISFGQQLNPRVLEAAYDHAYHCDCMLVLGSSLVVHPAASIPRIAKEQGAWLVIVNQSETPLDAMADLTINDSIGDIMRQTLLES